MIIANNSILGIAAQVGIMIVGLLGSQTFAADSRVPFSSIEPIESSNWTVNPTSYGMTAEEFIRAESLHFMKGMAAREGINNFFHFKSLAKADDKWVVSPNNDVIYSMGIVDTSKGFTLTLPETGDRFITAQIVTEEHMSHQLVGGGVYKFTGEEFPGSHVAIGVRVGTDASPQDVEYIVTQLQPKMTVESAASGAVPAYDEAVLLKTRTALMVEYNKLDNTFGLMTEDVTEVSDWEKFTYATAGAWGLSEDRYAMYLPYNLVGAKKDICYTATYQQPKVDQFWSITAYNNEKYLMANKDNIVNTGNVMLNADDTFTVHFGSEEACAGETMKNFILTTEDNWGFLMRAYEPDVEAFKAYQVSALKPVVTKGDYVIAETDWYFNEQQQRAPVNTFTHNKPVSKTAQNVIRSNRDVMYSLAVVDVSKGATFTVPARKAFQIIHIMDENHLSHRVVRSGSSLTLTPDDLTGGTHVYLLARTKITDDLEESLSAQRALKIEANSAIPYPSKGFIAEEVEAFRNALTAEFIRGEVKIIEHKSFGLTMDDLDPGSYLYASAVGWGGLPSHTAQYLAAVKGQGKTSCQKLTIPKPDIDWEQGGFFSLTTYDTDGWIVEDNFYIDHNKMQDDGASFTIFINCPETKNSITVQEGWTGILRFYLPRDETALINYIASIREIEVQDCKECK